MPYDPKDPPKKVRNLTPKQQRQWVHVYNSCEEAGGDTKKCHMQAWGVANKDNKKSFDMDRVAEEHPGTKKTIGNFVKSLFSSEDCGCGCNGAGTCKVPEVEVEVEAPGVEVEVEVKPRFREVGEVQAAMLMLAKSIIAAERVVVADNGTTMKDLAWAKRTIDGVRKFVDFDDDDSAEQVLLDLYSVAAEADRNHRTFGDKQEGKDAAQAIRLHSQLTKIIEEAQEAASMVFPRVFHLRNESYGFSDKLEVKKEGDKWILVGPVNERGKGVLLFKNELKQVRPDRFTVSRRMLNKLKTWEIGRLGFS